MSLGYEAAAFLNRYDKEMARLCKEADAKMYYEDYDEAKWYWQEDAIEVLRTLVAQCQLASV
jgi:hypothetical protein